MRHTADLTGRQIAENGQQTQNDKADNRQHLDQRKPELELAVVLDAKQVGGGQQQGDDQGKHPDRRTREPGMQDGTCGDSFQRDHQDPEPPVQPANGKTGPVPDGTVGVSGERTGVRRGNGHFGQHAHHQYNQRACCGIGQQHSGARLGNRVSGTDKQTGADNTGNRQHGHMPWFEPLFQAARGLRIAHWDYLSLKPFRAPALTFVKSNQRGV